MSEEIKTPLNNDDMTITAVCVKCDRIRTSGYNWLDRFIKPEDHRFYPGVVCPMCYPLK